ncbi:CD180 antigen [Gastrophryne carolinensis]
MDRMCLRQQHMAFMYPLEYCTEVEVIVNKTYDCEGLGLQQVPDSVPRTTEILDFSFNSLPALYYSTFCKLEQVEYLDLARCGITWIYDNAFSNNTKLQTILLIGNSILYIAERAFLGPTFLQHLYLQETFISDLYLIPLKSLPHLETLHLGSNFISSIRLPDGISLNELKTVNFEFNNIRTISVEDTNVLKKVDNLSLILKGNNIEYIEPNSFNSSSFYYLDLSGSARNVDVSSLLQGLNGLTTDSLNIGSFLDFDHSVAILPSSLKNLCNISLNELRLQYRQISGDSSESFPCLTKARKIDFTSADLHSLPQLEKDNVLKQLILNNNKFASLCNVSSNTYPLVTHLYIAGNRITVDLGDKCLKSLTGLQYLDLSSNDFEQTTCCSTYFSGLQNLIFLNISHGSRFTLQNPAFPDTNKIEILDFSYSHLLIDEAFSPFSNLESLKVLNLSNCYLNTSNRDFLFKGLHNLVFLNIEESLFPNGILTKKIFLHTLKLVTIIMSKCKLKSIEDTAFDKLQQLKHVDLSYNNLTVFNMNLFLNLTNVTINYAYNLITIIPIDLVRMISNQITINLSHNPIDCSCSNIDFLSWYKAHIDLYLDHKNTVCGSPPFLVGTELSKVSLSCDNSVYRAITAIICVLMTIILVGCFIQFYRKRVYASI